VIRNVIWVGRNQPSPELCTLLRKDRIDLGIVDFPGKFIEGPSLVRVIRRKVEHLGEVIGAINELWKAMAGDFIVLDNSSEHLLWDLKGLETTLMMNGEAYGIHGFVGSGDTGWVSWVPIIGTVFRFRSLSVMGGFKEGTVPDLTIAALELATRGKQFKMLPYRQVVRGRKVMKSREEIPTERSTKREPRIKRKVSISIFGEGQNLLALSTLVDLWSSLGEEVEIQVWAEQLAYSPQASFGVIPNFGEESQCSRKAQWIEASLVTDAEYLVLVDGLVAPIENSIFGHIRAQLRNSSVGAYSEGVFSIWCGLIAIKLESFRRMRLSPNLPWWKDQFPDPDRVFIATPYDGIRGSLAACGEEIKILGAKVAENIPGLLIADGLEDLKSLLERKNAAR